MGQTYVLILSLKSSTPAISLDANLSGEIRVLLWNAANRRDGETAVEWVMQAAVGTLYGPLQNVLKVKWKKMILNPAVIRIAHSEVVGFFALWATSLRNEQSTVFFIDQWLWITFKGNILAKCFHWKQRHSTKRRIDLVWLIVFLFGLPSIELSAELLGLSCEI